MEEQKIQNINTIVLQLLRAETILYLQAISTPCAFLFVFNFDLGLGGRLEVAASIELLKIIAVAGF